MDLTLGGVLGHQAGPITTGMRKCKSHSLLSICLAHILVDTVALSVPQWNGQIGNIPGVTEIFSKADVLGARLRGGGATSGIWDTFNRMQAEVKHNLHEVKVPFSRTHAYNVGTSACNSATTLCRCIVQRPHVWVLSEYSYFHSAPRHL